MDRDTAVQRINDGLGFMASGNAMESKIILRLQEAQRDLEKGKTLPKFLLIEDATLSLLSGTHSVALPAGFLRLDDDNLPHWFPDGGIEPVFLQQRFYSDAMSANLRNSQPTTFPSIFVLRNTILDFITTANIDYTLTWNYYKAADLLTTNIENLWLQHASDWLIGKAGARFARDARDGDALALFEAMEKEGRAAAFADDLLRETSGGPLQMGANN